MFAVVLSVTLGATPLPTGSWQSFFWSNGSGSISDPADGFDFTSDTPVVLRVADCCFIGDQFAIYIDNAPPVWSSLPVNNVGTDSGASDGDSA